MLLVNTSSNSHRPFRDLIPVKGITVELPFRVISAELLYPDEDPGFKVSKNILTINTINEFISIRIKAGK